MLGHLIRKEILDHILGFRFLILSALAGLVIWLSLYSGYSYYQSCLKDYRLAQAATEDRLRRIQMAEDWREIEKIGFHVHKPPTPMNIFVRGLEPVLGRSILHPASTNKQAKQSAEAAEPILGLFPPLDLGLVVQVVLSLFVLLFTYDAVCGEKEAGTLRLTSSFSVPRDRLLLGKLLGVSIPMHVAFGLPVLLGVGVLLLMPDVNLTNPELLRLGLILVTFGLYLTAFACAGLLASCLTHRAATSFVILLAFWTGSVIVLPRLSLIVADSLRPAISRHQYTMEIASIRRELGAENRSLRWKWRNEHPESAQGNPEAQEAYGVFYRKMSKELEERYKPRFDRLEQAFTNRYQNRLNLAVFLARLSPAFALKNATVRLSGAGVDRQQRFEGAYIRFNGVYLDWIWGALEDFYRRRFNEAKYGKYKWDVSGMPRFVYQETWTEEDVQIALVDVGILAVWGLALFAGAYVTMLRYDLR
ncbi:MAG: hypothetical protein A3F84_27485 [Candidatus Handelsmanbacteria bacterium RIFCSPLOWO2_12_FULL_64_10]|uniref:ABC transporter permease n=1 Tax=Handelsmanbacteria sp. (strain RIFCSPLOWO2_12_FULL_64_10) TaxID=1817868 RepID=A0A1F6D0M3_HANXR|nr:MAG: hypothetical protein A3F84_27485 [Candidatus Handelsmanbacteria bacterium RIFCSPLOWO2_12_FULL_64_10]